MTVVDVEPEADARPDATRPRRRQRAIHAFVLVSAIALRLWSVYGPLGTTDSDEVIGALMGRHVFNGEFPTFFWGQNYAGTAESFLFAPVFRLPPNVLFLRLPSLLLGAVAAVLLYRIALATTDVRRARWSVAVFLLWPLTFVWFSTREMLFYTPTIALGLLIVRCVQRVDEQPTRRADWAVIGLATGVAWWLGPNVVYFVVPCGLWLLWRRSWRALLRAPIAVPFALLGAAPWLHWNLHADTSSLYVAPVFREGSYVDHLRYWFTHGFPTAVGARMPMSEEWMITPWFGKLLYAVTGAVLVAAVVVAIRRYRAPSIAVLALAVTPFIFAIVPTRPVVAQGRYFFFVWPFLALLLGGLASAARWRTVLTGLLVASTLISLQQLPSATDRFAPDAGHLTHALEQRGLTHVFANYWTAYMIDYESGEDVVAQPFAVNRYQPYDDEVRAASRVGYVFSAGDPGEQVFLSGLQALGVSAAVTPVGPYHVYEPDRVVYPEQVAPAGALGQ